MEWCQYLEKAIQILSATLSPIVAYYGITLTKKINKLSEQKLEHELFDEQEEIFVQLTGSIAEILQKQMASFKTIKNIHSLERKIRVKLNFIKEDYDKLKDEIKDYIDNFYERIEYKDMLQDELYTDEQEKSNIENKLKILTRNKSNILKNIYQISQDINQKYEEKINEKENND